MQARGVLLEEDLAVRGEEGGKKGGGPCNRLPSVLDMAKRENKVYKTIDL